MIPPEYLPYQEAADHLGSQESLRQAILARALPVYLKLDSASATSLDDEGDHLASGKTVFSTWERREHWFDVKEMVADQGELAEGYEPSDDAHDGLDRTVSYTLTGWFLLAPTYGRHIAFEHPAVYRGTAHVATSPNEESPNNGKSEGTSAIHWFDVGTNVALKDVWFRSSDINLMTNSTSTKASSGTVSTRERNSMLRLISALATMAKLPEKAPAKSIEKQLEQLGLDSPKEATIKRLLEEARENTPLQKSTDSTSAKP